MTPEPDDAHEEPLVLAVSFYFPPAPQAPGLRARELLAGSGLPVLLLRGHQPGTTLLPTLADTHHFTPLAELLVTRQHERGRNRLWAWLGQGWSEPGTWREWVELASRASRRHLVLSGHRPRVVVSFGPPAAGHQAAQVLARELGLPWVALCGAAAGPEEAQARAEADLILLDGPAVVQPTELAGRSVHLLPQGPDAAHLFKRLILELAAQGEAAKSAIG